MTNNNDGATGGQATARRRVPLFSRRVLVALATTAVADARRTVRLWSFAQVIVSWLWAGASFEHWPSTHQYDAMYKLQLLATSATVTLTLHLTDFAFPPANAAVIAVHLYLNWKLTSGRLVLAIAIAGVALILAIVAALLLDIDIAGDIILGNLVREDENPLVRVVLWMVAVRSSSILEQTEEGVIRHVEHGEETIVDKRLRRHK